MRAASVAIVVRHARRVARTRTEGAYPAVDDACAAIVGSPQAEMLLIQRAVRSSDPWSGQLAFPGGKANGKETLLETALRETKEETAVDLGDSHTFQMAGSLGSVDRDRLTIHAFGKGGELYTQCLCLFGTDFQEVFLQHERTGSPALHLAGDEVAHACWVPFRHFLEASVDHRRYSMAPYLKRHRMGVLVDAVDFLTNGNAHSTLSFPSVPVECDSITNHLWGLSLQFVSAIIRRGGHPARAAQLTPSAAVRCILALRTTYTRLITVSR